MDNKKIVLEEFDKTLNEILMLDELLSEIDDMLKKHD